VPSSRRKQKTSSLVVSDIPGAREAPLPAKIEAELATLEETAPDGDGWLHEVKFDGYRILAWIVDRNARLISRNDLDWTPRFRRIAEALPSVAREAILDGEIVALDERGASNFGTLQQALSGGAGTKADLAYMVFDLLYLDSYDLRACRLEDRKALLAQLLAGAPPLIRYSDHVIGSGARFHQAACKQQLEGIVSKRRAAPYRGGRQADWIKVKCTHREEFAVIGWTDPSGSRIGIGSLILGYYDQAGALYLAGKVGTGFSDRVLGDLRRSVEQIPAMRRPFGKLPSNFTISRSHWIQPQLVAEVRFVEWTHDGIIRHPAFLGLREDKAVTEVRREPPPGAIRATPARSG
jgi:bifunctional non-homologous end joining protein LigD